STPLLVLCPRDEDKVVSVPAHRSRPLTVVPCVNPHHPAPSGKPVCSRDLTGRHPVAWRGRGSTGCCAATGSRVGPGGIRLTSPAGMSTALTGGYPRAWRAWLFAMG